MRATVAGAILLTRLLDPRTSQPVQRTPVIAAFLTIVWTLAVPAELPVPPEPPVVAAPFVLAVPAGSAAPFVSAVSAGSAAPFVSAVSSAQAVSFVSAVSSTIHGPGVALVAGPHFEDEEFDRRMDAAEKDVRKLWDVLIWCEDTERESDAKKVLRAIVRVDPDHKKARERLGHANHEGEWFTSQKKLDVHLEKEREREAKAQGLVRYEGDWVLPADLVHLKRGMVRGPQERWITTREAERLEQGWVRQDLVWVSPDEREQMEAGLWKCGEAWLKLDQADRWHSRIQRPWVIPTENLTVWSTAKRSVAERAIEVMERAYRDMTRIYGREPSEHLPVLVMANSEQLSSFSGRSTKGGGSRDGRRLHRALRAVYLESWVEEDPFAWRGAGACFWDANEENGDRYGVHDARMALGLSFSQAMDPSPKALAKIQKRGLNARFLDDFYSEKELPAWFRWGAACYASRYYEDSVASGGDPWWARKWSVKNLQSGGGIPFLRAIFGFVPDGGNRGTSRLLNAAGLLVAFMLDGDCAPVEAVHADLVDALAKGADTGKIMARLRKEIQAHEDELNAFARR